MTTKVPPFSRKLNLFLLHYRLSPPISLLMRLLSLHLVCYRCFLPYTPLRLSSGLHLRLSGFAEVVLATHSFARFVLLVRILLALLMLAIIIRIDRHSRSL